VYYPRTIYIAGLDELFDLELPQGVEGEGW
jgi:hypothetical protein